MGWVDRPLFGWGGPPRPLGGADGSRTCDDDVRFDLLTQTWERDGDESIAPEEGPVVIRRRPSPRFGHAVVPCGRRLFLLGGSDDVDYHADAWCRTLDPPSLRALCLRHLLQTPSIRAGAADRC